MPSPTFCPTPREAAHGDKDQCDEKQQRQQARAPFVGETLALKAPRNQSNVAAAECR